jgi:hypothetical protein
LGVRRQTEEKWRANTELSEPRSTYHVRSHAGWCVPAEGPPVGECFDRIEDPWVPLNPKQGSPTILWGELKEGNAPRNLYVLTSLAPRTNGGDAEKSCLRSGPTILKGCTSCFRCTLSQQSSNWLVRMVCRTMIWIPIPLPFEHTSMKAASFGSYQLITPPLHTPHMRHGDNHTYLKCSPIEF